jgi:hypothetical protein
MVFNATFNNISVISCWSVLLLEETGVPGDNHWPAASHCMEYTSPEQDLNSQHDHDQDGTKWIKASVNFL